jgi:hypothetical protein
LIGGLALATTTAVGFILGLLFSWGTEFIGEDFLKTFVAALLISFGFSALAQNTNSTTTKASDLVKQSEQKDIDNEITNAKLRADSGSKSKHSISISAAYSGGTLEDAFGKKRPNIVGAAGTETLSALTGSLNYRYRLTPGDSVTAGFGVKWIAPGHDFEKSESDKISKQEASNPSIGYTKAMKAFGVQNISAAAITKITSSQVLDREKMNGYLYFSHTALGEIGTSGWQIGLTAAATSYMYNEYLPGRDSSGKQAETPQTEYEVGLYPVAEYIFNDRYNFRTVFRGNSYGSTRDNRFAFEQLEPTQSMGLGIAATRDIYLYPNVQFVWRDVRSERTNASLTATMNFL